MASDAEVELIQRVYDRLKKEGCETPIVDRAVPENIEQIIAIKFHDMLHHLGMDMDDDSLADTPKRVAKMFVHEMFSGLDYTNFPRITLIDNKMGCNEMVVIRNIEIQSTCEHHLVPFLGKATVGYIPGKKIIGLSKINRICDFFSRRPQVQERLTQQIFYSLQEILETEDVAVSINAVHLCVKIRGVKDTNSSTVTNKVGGLFMSDLGAKQEFLKYVHID